SGLNVRMERAIHVSILGGPVEALRPVRTFTDGQLFEAIKANDGNGVQREVPHVFCTNKLLNAIRLPRVEKIYLWHNHIFAVETSEALLEDVDGVKRSYLYRDRFALLLMAASVILAPYALWVVAKKLYGSLSIPEMTDAFRNA